MPWDTMLLRQERAEAIGLTYEEYSLEILERGIYLTADHADRIEAIKRARQRPTLVGGPSGEPSGGLRGRLAPPPIGGRRVSGRRLR